MERKCSQSIKIPFPIKVFHGTDVIINIPRAGNMIKNIRLVIDGIQNILGERIIEKAEFLSGDDEILETVYGEFIHVENTFKVPIEKRSKLDELLCVNTFGKMYMKIPFMCTNNEGFFIFDTEPKVRILFGNLPGINDELLGYLLIDYYVTESVPQLPYVQKIKQIQRFSSVVTSASSVNMHVYAVGPIYELFFTVKDTTSGEYIDAISNVTLFFGEKERFSLSGHYLRYIEPMKRYGVYLREPMYMYSFCEHPRVTNIPSGSTHFYENSFFKIDLFGNDSTYEITIWAQSHNFMYQKETASLMFKSTEMLLDAATITGGIAGEEAPLRVSYSDFAGSATIYYSSPYEVSNVLVITDAPSYTILQDSILFQKIDSSFTEYTANVTFSTQGFQDTTCYFKFRGSGMYLNKIVYSPDGNWPTHIDKGQNFHYVFENTFNTNHIIFDNSTIQTFTIDDENKNYSFTTYVPSTSTSIVSTYDQSMNSLYTVTSQNSNTCAPSSNVLGFYGYNISVNGFGTIPSLHQGVIINKDNGTINWINAGSTSKVYVDNLDTVSTYILASVRVESSSSNFVASGTATTNFGNGTARTALVKISNGVPAFLSVLSSANMNPKTDVHVNSDGKCVWAYAYTSSSTLSVPPTTYSTSGGYSVGKFDILTSVREWNVNVACTPSSLDMKLVVGEILENIYMIAGYTSDSTPTLSGFTFVNGNGFMVLKINKYGVVKYVLSFTGTIIDVYPILDSVTGKFMLSVKSAQAIPVNMYNNSSVPKYSDVGEYQFFIFDDYGNINSSSTDLNQYFSVPKPIYYVPPNASTYFSEPQLNPPAYTYWNSIVSGPGNENIKSISTDSLGHVYYSYSSTSYSNIYDKYGDTLVRLPSDRRAVCVKLFSNCVYGGYTLSLTNTRDDNNYISVNSDSTYIYLLCTTNVSGTTSLYDKTGTSVFTFSPSSNTLLLLRFTMDGLYDNWYMHIPTCNGLKIKIDSNNNIYVTGVKIGTSATNIHVNGSVISNVPLTTTSYTSIIVKISSNHIFAWRSYIDGGSDGDDRFISAAITSDGYVYLSGTKITNTALINGSTTLPATNALSTYIVKFNASDGTYANWYSYVDGTVSGDDCLSEDAQVTPSNEVAITIAAGGFVGTDSEFRVYVSGTSGYSSFYKIKNVTGTLVKYTSGGAYEWNVRFAPAVGTSGNFSNFHSFAVDPVGNFIVTGLKQAYVFGVYDRYGNAGGEIPASTNQTGVIIKINANGTYSNNYGYFDSVWNDNSTSITIDKNGNVLIGGYLGGVTGGNLTYIYDKNGFVTYVNSYDVSTTYGFLAKFNANFTMNKISL